MLLSPEAVSLVGSACQLSPAADGHALLLGIPGTAPSSPSKLQNATPRSDRAADGKPAKQKAGQELMTLAPSLQLRAVKVMSCCSHEDI